jgi:hypothetical protein
VDESQREGEGEDGDDEGCDCCEQVGACQEGRAGVGLDLSVLTSQISRHVSDISMSVGMTYRWNCSEKDV